MIQGWMAIKNYKLLSVYVLATLIAISFVLADITPEYQKIPLDPLYRSSLSANTNYQYNISVNAPDGINQILSAIINLEMYVAPTINVNLTINGKACNPNIYTVSTTFSGASQADLAFDCTNIIKAAGNYTAILRTDKITGATAAYLDLTYLNKPAGQAKVSGTEYQIGDKASVFLQLTEEQGLPVANASCFVTIYQPLNASSQYPILINNAPMIFDGNINGIYRYDLTAPNTTGVYPVSASCAYSTIGGYVYDTDPSETNRPNRTVLQAQDTDGDPINLNRYDDALYTHCDSTAAILGTRFCTNQYDYNLSIHSLQTNASFISLYWMGEGSVAANLKFLFWNWTNPASNKWTQLPNTITFDPTGSQVPVFLSEFVSNTLPLQSINATTGIIRIITNTTHTADFDENFNWLNIRVSTLTGVPQKVSGNSELHISDYASQILAAIANINTTSQIASLQSAISNLSGQVGNLSSQQSSQYINLSTTLNNLNSTITQQNQAVLNNLTIIMQNQNATGNRTEQLYNLLLFVNATTTQNQQSILSINATLNSFLTSIQTQITSVYTNLTAQQTADTLSIIAFINSTYNNLSNQISVGNAQVMTQITSVYTNLSSQITNLNNTFIYNFNSMNQSLQNLTNITQTNQNLLQMIWAYLTGFVTDTLLNLNSTVNNINITVTENQQLLNDILNQTNFNSTRVATTISTVNNQCIEGSDWLIEATVKDQFGQVMGFPPTVCSINTTNAFVTPTPQNMTYNSTNQIYRFRTTCPSPDTWNWTITCD